MNYKDYQKWLQNIDEGLLKIKVVGKSVLGNKIYALMLENNPSRPWAIITGGIHAREHLSCDLVCRLINDCIKRKTDICINLAFIPLINPDGANLATGELKGLSKKRKKLLIKINNGSDFSLYKANANGVDLNNNFPANWEHNFSKQNKPGGSGFYGTKPLSEPESIALAKFTTKLKPFLTISYHLKGEEIYFDFFQSGEKYCLDKKIAQIFAKSTGYKIKSTQNSSSGGYKDWCVQNNISALTIELGEDGFSHPYPAGEIESIYNKNKNFVNDIQKCYKLYMEYINGTNETSIQDGSKGVQKR